MAEHKKKRDRYAGAAYEFGANAGLSGAGMGAAASPAAPQYGVPAQGYSPGIPMSPPGQDPNALGQQFGQMTLGPQPVQVTPQMQPTAQMQQNQLYPSDLIAQPVHASEIDSPPPPINLPPNLAATPSPHSNCPPPYIRSTLACVPTTHSLLKKSKLPFSLIVQPYTSLHDADAPVPVVDDQVISRCRRCRHVLPGSAVSNCSWTDWLQGIHQPLRDLSRPRTQMAMQYVQPNKRRAAGPYPLFAPSVHRH